jgi:hypothetical protein
MTSVDRAPRAGRQALMFVSAVLFGMFYTAIVVSQFVGVAQGGSRDSA